MDIKTESPARTARNHRFAAQHKIRQPNEVVAFYSAAFQNVAIQADVAVRLLKLMGLPGNIPGAIAPDGIPFALNQLRNSFAINADALVHPGTGSNWETGGDAQISIRHRAAPLIQLMTAAMRSNVPVLWS